MLRVSSFYLGRKYLSGIVIIQPAMFGTRDSAQEVFEDCFRSRQISSSHILLFFGITISRSWTASTPGSRLRGLRKYLSVVYDLPSKNLLVTCGDPLNQSVEKSEFGNKERIKLLYLFTCIVYNKNVLDITCALKNNAFNHIFNAFRKFSIRYDNTTNLTKRIERHKFTKFNLNLLSP